MATVADFEQAVAFVFRHEGGYVNDPDDPGGETKYGISKRSYPWLDIAHLTQADAKQVYFDDYWKPSGAMHLAMPLALVVFDTAVNMGVGRARDFLSQSASDLPTFLALREDRYRLLARTNPTLAKFLPGWLNRLSALKAAAVVGGVGLALVAAVVLGLAVVRRFA